MKSFALFLLTLLLIPAAQAIVNAGLPTPARSEQPGLLLELGQEPAALTADPASLRVVGAVSNHAGDSAIRIDKDEINVLHPGFGHWQVSFRFQLPPGFAEQNYRFWARWRQGGEPDVCVQNFEIWAGTDPGKLEQRGVFSLKPKGWEPAWLAGEAAVTLKSDDLFIEVRNSGNAHDAKVFDAFLLEPSLPVSGSRDQPLVLLDLGQERPANPDPHQQLFVGTATAGGGAASLLTVKDEVQVFHPGFGNWGADFRFALNPALKPGHYRFFARYKSGGEVSQVRQNFTVKAGAKADELATRSTFSLLNNTPWEYQWLPATDTLTLLPGDRWLEINNSGKADGAKVFDAFLLKLETPLGDWMSVEQAQLRNHFLSLRKTQADAPQHLYVLDGKGDPNDKLFLGLAADAVRSHYEQLSVRYLIGPEADAMAQRLNLALPAALISDDHYGIQGVLSQPSHADEVLKFMRNPIAAGHMPQPKAVPAETAQPLQHGSPAAWLVGGLMDGQAGLAAYGLDSETVLRPNPDQAYVSLQMMGGTMRTWQIAASQTDGTTDVAANTQHDYGWSRGSGYAQLYLHTEQTTQAWLHLQHSGIKTAAWLDGQALPLEQDSQPPSHSVSPIERAKNLLHGLTTEGLLATATAEHPALPQVGVLNLSPGWHSLLVKMVMQHEAGQRFFFSGILTDTTGQPLDNITTQTSDPNADLALNRIAAQLRPLLFVDAPANLPHPGEPLKLRVDLRWQPILEEPQLSTPLPRFPATLRLRLLDYTGHEIAVREVNGQFPNQVEVDFGKTPTTGYYAVYASLHSAEGRLIMTYPADGFSVVAGSAAQQQRLAHKKLWNNDYYALADGNNSFVKQDGYFAWLERMGIFRSYGSYPGFDAQYLGLWQQAKQRGLQLFADSSGDSAWLNDKPEDGERFISAATPFTRFFKASNEIDIRHEAEWQTLREPAHWVERARREFTQSHRLRQDAHYVGGSLVRPGEGEWFKQVLQLGLDQYQDAWDVHAYPQLPPRFNGPIGNGASEDERGVLATYASLGKKNHLPFWLGETGAKALHGFSGRRWQAEQAAKMIAWTNSRSDYLGLAFCIAHEYDLAYGRLWDYSLGHKPGEAALYTAGALIDGLPYQAVDTQDNAIQTAYFGSTLMLWRGDETIGPWPLKLDPGKDWVFVNVVGQLQSLPVDPAGNAVISLSASPIYVLPRADYQRLTRY